MALEGDNPEFRAQVIKNAKAEAKKAQEAIRMGIAVEIVRQCEEVPFASKAKNISRKCDKRGYNIKIPRLLGETNNAWECRTKTVADFFNEQLPGAQVAHKRFKAGRIVAHVEPESEADLILANPHAVVYYGPQVVCW